MESLGISETDIKQEYAISEEQFRQSPAETTTDNVSKYIYGDRVTRENFTSMLIQSFAVSRGVVEGQWAYWQWLQLNTGFDYKASLANFGKAGGWEALTDKERDMFKGAFSKVNNRYHNGGNPTVSEGKDTDKRITYGINDTITEFTNNKLLAPYKGEGWPDLKTLPKQKVFSEISSNVSKIKASRK